MCDIKDTCIFFLSTRQASPDFGILFTASDVLVLSSYPKAVSGNLHVVFALRIPDPFTLVDSSAPALVPRATLIIICLSMSPSLVESTGAYVLGISIYEPPEYVSDTSIDQEVILGTTIPAVILLLALAGISVG